MKIKPITEHERDAYNAIVFHPLQSFEWGQFREKTGIKVIRRGVFENNKLVDAFQLTIHKIPYTKWTIGYLPKGTMPTDGVIRELQTIGKEYNCIFIQLEPNVVREDTQSPMEKLMKEFPIKQSAYPLFTKFTFQLNLTPSEEDLLKNMHPKTRYNIKVAKRHKVSVTEETSDEAFEIYWALMHETTTRQHFFAHTKRYHKLMWETLQGVHKNGLEAHLFLAKYTPENETESIPLGAWVLFTFHKNLYYPYGASSNAYRNVMASNLLMWEAIRFGKAKGLTLFDMWGSLGENPNPQDPWYGFHRLKQGYAPKLVEFIGSFDVIINPAAYQLYKSVNKFRWLLLRSGG